MNNQKIPNKCPNCKSTEMEIDFDTYTIKCKYCHSTFPLEFEGQGKIFLEKEKRKTIAFKNEEERKQYEFFRTRNIQNFRNNIKWAGLGIFLGILCAVVIYFLFHTGTISIIAGALVVPLFIPAMVENRNTNTLIRIACGLMLICAIISAFSVHKGTIEKQEKERKLIEDEEQAPKVEMEYSANELVGRHYSEVMSLFYENGFKNVTAEAVDDLTISTAEQIGIVSEISIKDVTYFKKGDIFPDIFPVKIKYHNLSEDEAKIMMQEGAEDFYLMDYKTAEAQLRNMGFINITPVPIFDLKWGIIVPNGGVEKVIINGDSSFSSYTEFRYDAPVIIEYHRFISESENKSAAIIQNMFYLEH